MKHALAFLILLALLLFVMARNVSPDPYIYDEADYMYAASLGFAANYTDTPALPLAEFIRTGLGRGRDAGQRQALSELIRSSSDVVFYRHWHGPLYIYFLIPVSRLGLNEQAVRTIMLAIPALTLAVIYFGCLYARGILAALLGSVLFVSSSAVVRTTELAPHHLFVLCSLCSLFLLAKNYWYPAVVMAGLAFCTMEIAFVLIFTLALFVRGWRVAARSLAVFGVTVLVVWPAALYKLSFLKSYLFMAYLALFRKSPWGDVGFLETWRGRFVDSPLEWLAIVASLAIYFRMRAAHQKPFLAYGAMMVIATLRILTSTARYSLLFMPALDVFAGITLIEFLASLSRRTVYALLALLAISDYRFVAHARKPDPRPGEVLSYIRQHQLEEKALLVPQDDLPMIHYYFPRTHLRGYYGPQPAASDFDRFAPDEILKR
jgi:hypothetical protein